MSVGQQPTMVPAKLKSTAPLSHCGLARAPDGLNVVAGNMIVCFANQPANKRTNEKKKIMKYYDVCNSIVLI